MDIFRCIRGEDWRGRGSGEHARRLNGVCGFCALLGVVSIVSIAGGGTLTTLDGKRYEGPISFEAENKLVVSLKDGTKEPVDFSNVLSVNFVPENRPLYRGVVLASGEVIAADSITQLNSDGVRLVRPGGIAAEFPASEVASVLFRPVSAAMLGRLPAGHGGAVLDNGDFFEGDPDGFDGNHVKISSVLFGIQSFDVARQARAVILQDAAVPDANEVVKLVDGSVLLGKAASVSAERLTIDDARLGTVTVEGRTVAQISMGGDAFDGLAKLAPTKVDGPADGYAIDATTAGVPMNLLGINPSHGIGQRPGVSLSWDVGSKYKSVIAKAGVPLGVVPLQHLQFVVLADDKEVFRSAPQSSIDDPAAIAVSLTDVKTLTFRVDGAAAQAPGAAGLWADPIMVRGSK